MNKRRLIEKLNSLLPLYVNRSLNPIGRLIVKWWLLWSPAARGELDQLQRLSIALNSQPLKRPDPTVYRRIKKEIAHHPRSATAGINIWSLWALQIVLAILAFLLVWRGLPPEIVLQWSTEGTQPDKFRVYRAQIDALEHPDKPQFILIDEIPAGDGNQPYLYSEIRLLPGQAYIYRVDAVDQHGHLTDSKSVIGPMRDLLPSQLALIFLVSVILYAGWRSSRHWRSNTRHVGGFRPY